MLARSFFGSATLTMAKTGISVRSRQMPAIANNAPCGVLQSDAVLVCVRSIAVAGTRHRNSTWRKLPIQNGLATLRTVGTHCTWPDDVMLLGAG